MIQALGENIIVRVIYEEQVGNIVLPGGKGVYNQYHGFIYAIVHSIGSRFPYKELQVGDKILFVRHEGKKIKYDGEEYLKLKEARVLVILRKEA